MFSTVCYAYVTHNSYYIFAVMDLKISDVNNTRIDWRIRVRLTRMWPSFSRNQHFLGFNMILLDSEAFYQLIILLLLSFSSLVCTNRFNL